MKITERKDLVSGKVYWVRFSSTGEWDLLEVYVTVPSRWNKLTAPEISLCVFGSDMPLEDDPEIIYGERVLPPEEKE